MGSQKDGKYRQEGMIRSDACLIGVPEGKEKWNCSEAI